MVIRRSFRRAVRVWNSTKRARSFNFLCDDSLERLLNNRPTIDETTLSRNHVGSAFEYSRVISWIAFPNPRERVCA